MLPHCAVGTLLRLLMLLTACAHRCHHLCLAQSHFTRGVPSSDRSASELMTPPYQRRQDEYHLFLNCSPAMQHPASVATFQVEMTPGGRLQPSSRLTWVVKPSDAFDYIGDYLPMLAFVMDPGCGRAEPVNPSRVPPPDGPPPVASIAPEYLALVGAQGCSISQVVRAVRRIHRDSRVFLLYGPGDRSMRTEVLEDQMTQPNLCVFVYEQTPLAAQLAREMRNRTCSVSLSFRLGAYDSLINKTSVLFVSVSFILLMIISLSWLVFYYVQRFRYLHAKERLSRRLGNAAKKALTKIPVRILKPGDRDFTWIGDQCAVCIEPYRVSDSVRILPCKHFYHRSCIDPWLLDQRTCPLCKLDILKAYGLQIRDHRGSRGSLLDGRLTPENSQAAESAAASAAASSSAAAASSAADVGGVVLLSSQPQLLLAQYSCGHHHHRSQHLPQSAEPDDDDGEAEVCYPLVHHHQNHQRLHHQVHHQ